MNGWRSRRQGFPDLFVFWIAAGDLRKRFWEKVTTLEQRHIDIDYKGTDEAAFKNTYRPARL